MAQKLTIEQLANATGQKVSTIRVHVNRKRVTRGKDLMFNVELDKNKAYINEITKGAGLYGKVTIEKVVKGKEATKEKEEPVKSERENVYQNLELRKKQSEVELSERNAELKRMELEKRAGNLLPVDVVEKILVINIQSILKAFKSEQDNINSVYVERLGGSSKILAEIRAKQDIIFDRATKKAEKDAMFEIDNAISTYQDVRGVGQRK